MAQYVRVDAILAECCLIYCSSPRLFSHSPTSTATSPRLVMLEADYCARGLLLSRQRNAVEVLQFRLTAGKQICPGRQQWIVMINAGSKNRPLAFRSDLVLDYGPKII